MALRLVRSRAAISKRGGDTVLVVACFLLAFALYARTAAPGVLDDDGGEFQTNIYRLGVSHTGYPLFFLLAKLWTLVFPFGSIAYRANLFSGLLGAAVVALIYVTVRVLTASRLSAFFAAALLAVSRVEWSQSVIPRVYTLNSFFVVLIILLGVLWRSGRIPLWSLVFAFGLSLTNHRTMIWLAPGLGLFVLAGEWRTLFQPWRLATLAVAFLLPLLLYLYVPLRGDSDVGVEYHASQFSEMILAGNASSWLRFGPPGFLWDRISAFYLPLQIEQFTLPVFAIGLLGMMGLATNHVPGRSPKAIPPRHLLVFLGVGFVFESAFAVVFWTLDSEKYFLPSYLIWLIWAGIGLALLFDRLPILRTAVGSAVASVAMAGLVIFLLYSNFQRVDMSARDEVETRWQEIFSQPIEAGALLVGNWESLTPLEYYQYVENNRSDLKRNKVIIYRDQLKLVPQGEVATKIAGVLAASRPVYLTLHPEQTETLGRLAQQFDLVPIASLWRVLPHQQPSPTVDLGARFGSDLILKSAAFPLKVETGDFVPLNLKWLPERALDQNVKLSLRLRDLTDRLWMQRDAEPFGGLKPSAEWPARQELSDTEGLFVPPDAPPGDYSLRLALYDSDSHVPLTAEGHPELTLGTINVVSVETHVPIETLKLPHLLPGDTGSPGKPRIVGYGASAEQPRAGDTVALNLWLEGLTNGASEIQVDLRDSAGTNTTLYAGSMFPDVQSQFDAKQIVRLRLDSNLPPSAAPGKADLSVLLEGQRLALGALTLRPTNRLFVMPQIGHAQVARLGPIEFLGYDMQMNGEKVLVTLYWHAAESVPNSFTIFTHILNGNGLLLAQQDSLPRGGDLPTNRWLAGEYIVDEHTLSPSSDALPGNYQLEVGLYSADTGVRVPVLDGNGVRQAEDRILLDTPVRIGK